MDKKLIKAKTCSRAKEFYRRLLSECHLRRLYHPILVRFRARLTRGCIDATNRLSFNPMEPARLIPGFGCRRSSPSGCLPQQGSGVSSREVVGA